MVASSRWRGRRPKARLCDATSVGAEGFDNPELMKAPSEGRTKFDGLPTSASSPRAQSPTTWTHAARRGDRDIDNVGCTHPRNDAPVKKSAATPPIF